MSGNQRKVILYGDTLILAGVQAGLEACREFEVIPLSPSHASLLEEVTDSEVVALIFDAAVQPDFPSSLLQQSTLLLIGIDPETHQALVWSGRSTQALNAIDVENAIRSNIHKSLIEHASCAAGQELKYVPMPRTFE